MLRKKQNLFLVLILLIVGAFLLPQISQAQILVPQVDNLLTGSVEQIAGSIIQVFLGLLGLIALVIVIYAGFKWMTSGGNEEKIAQAKKMLMAGVIGLIIILASYIITSFILDAVQGSLDPGSSIQCNPGDCMSCNRVCNSDGDGTYYNPDACENLCDTGGTTKHDFLSTWHSPNGDDVSLCAMIQIGFNGNVKASTVTADNFGFYECGDTVCTIADVTEPGNPFVNSFNSGTITVDNDDNGIIGIIQFVYNEDYKVNTYYLVYLPQFGIENTNGDSLADPVKWNFQTGTVMDVTPPTVNLIDGIPDVFPEDNKINVCLASHVRATFSEDMDVLSLRDEDAFDLYLEDGNLSGLTFNHQINNSRTVLFKADSLYSQDTNYFPVLNSNVIRDVCGNYLDGDGNGAVNDPPDNSPDNDFPPGNPPQSAWDFTTGENAECTPVVDDIDLGVAYYDGNYLTIKGNYLDGAVLTFNNGLSINDESTSCIGVDADNNSWPDELCNFSWANNQIQVYVPSIEGSSNGALSGDIIVTTSQGYTNTSFELLSPRINDIFPDEGGPGQYVSVLGQNFGKDQDDSKIYFRNEDGDSYEANLPCNDSSWSKDNIIISVNSPDHTLETGFWRIQVEKDDAGVKYWSNLGDFYITEEEAGPGLCPIADNNFNVGDSFSLNGVRLGDGGFEKREVILGNDYSSKEALSPIWSDPDPIDDYDRKVEAIIPFMGAGNNIGVRVVTQEVEDDLERLSNYVQLNIEADTSSAFRITSTTPISAPVHGYVTIYGSGFENSQDNKEVWFRTGTGPDTWTKGDDESFSSVCAAASWSDSRVVIKVPEDFIGYVLPYYYSAIKIVDLDDVGDIIAETNAVDFTVDDGDPAPAICGLNFDYGAQGNEIEVYGEYFENPDVDKFYFNAIFNSNNNFISGTEASSLTVNSDEKLTVKVPVTETGLLVASVGTNFGNTWNFEYIDSTGEPTSVWDFYGWEFITCEDCERPQVKRSVCSVGSSSPSPEPGSMDVPQDTMSVSVQFEYPSGNLLAMNTNTLKENNINFYKCEVGANPGDCDIDNLGINSIDPTVTSLDFDFDDFLESDTWYKVELTTNITDDEGARLISNNDEGDAYEWYFHVNDEGGHCDPEYLNINPNDCSLVYESGWDLNYSAHLTDAGCYICNDTNYNYTWDKEDEHSLVSLLNPPSIISNTTVTLNNDWKIGDLMIQATSTDAISGEELFNETPLTIMANCGLLNGNQDQCIDEDDSFNCCWDASNNTCVNDDQPVCNSPFVIVKDCIPAGWGQNPILSSPSPVPNNMNVALDSHVYAEFKKSNVQVEMDTNTYADGLKIERCGVYKILFLPGGETVSTFIDDDCVDVSGSLNIQVESFGDNFVDYSHDGFDPNFFYVITLKDSIKDISGYSLTSNGIHPYGGSSVGHIWTFKTGSSPCQTENIEVLPTDWSMSVNKTKKYSTLCYDESCNICPPNSNHIYDWSSTEPTFATVDENNHKSSNIATGVSEGDTDIIATNTNLSLSNYGELTVSGGSNNHPRVREEACGSDYSSSPSPYPNNENVPIDPIIYVEFEYPNGSLANMDVSTYPAGDAILYKCSEGPVVCDQSIATEKINSTSFSTFLKFEVTNNLEAGVLYKVVLTDNIKDEFDESLDEGYEWQFRVNTFGNLCQPDTVGVEPDDSIVSFSAAAGKSRIYKASLWDSTDCYNCADTGYIYSWLEGAGDTADIITVNSSAISTTSVSIGETWDPANSTNIDSGIIESSASDGTNSVSGDTNLTIEKNVAGSFNILSKYPEDGGSDICPNTLIKVEFDEPIDSSTLEADNIILFPASGEIATTTYSTYGDFEGNGILNIYIEDLLATSTEYVVSLKGGDTGIKSIYGNVLDCPARRSCKWSFTTAAEVCDLSYVKIVTPAEDYYEFNTADAHETFGVEARTISGDPIVSILGVYDWSWYWESFNEDLVVLEPTEIYGSSVEATAQNANGKTKVRINALPIPSELMCSLFNVFDEAVCENNSCCWVDGVCTATLDSDHCDANLNSYNAKAGYKGGALSDEIEVTLFMCENPWTLGDDDFDFQLEYCKDGGLDHFVTSTPAYPSGPDDLLKEYIFRASSTSRILNPTQEIVLEDIKSDDNILSQVGVLNLTDNIFSFKLIGKMFKKFVSGFFREKVFAQQNYASNDIIGLRIYKNNKHYSAMDWYHLSGVVQYPGNPQPTKIDGYNGLIDGRTVYVNAANKDSSGNLWTNIYLISYSQDVIPGTVNIFNQLTENWGFNFGIDLSAKQEIVEDVQRWEDIRSMERKLDSYASQHKYCAYVKDPGGSFCPSGYYHFDIDSDGAIDSFNEATEESSECYDVSQTVTCNSDTKCQNHDMCSGFEPEECKCVGVYPELNEGTYVQRVSTSKWPSWTATLGNEIGSALPVDPVNDFNGCPEDYNEETCWDEIGEEFICPSGSQIYYYQAATTTRALSFNLYSLLNNDIGLWKDDNVSTQSFNNLDMTNSICDSAVVATCGDGIPDPGEECEIGDSHEYCRIDDEYYNPMTVGCRMSDCQWYPQPEPCQNCGDDVVNGDEFCDGQTLTFCENDYNPQTVICNADCDGWVPNLQACRYCGDGTCEETEGENSIICYADCEAECRNNILELGEACDDGNIDSGDGCSLDCQDDEICGNGILGWSDPDGDGGYTDEECDDGNTISGDGCSADCVLEPSAFCGDFILGQDEDCEIGDIGSQCTTTDNYYGNRQCKATTLYEADPPVLPPYTLDKCSWEPDTKPDHIWCPINDYCGDTIVNGPEECDYGMHCDSGTSCEEDADCSAGDCEVRDHLSSTEFCKSDCTLGTFCGDDNRDRPNDFGVDEGCDNGNDNGNVCSPSYNDDCTYCSDTCTSVTLFGEHCGDSSINGPEECDDGGRINGDGCDADCKIECGNGVKGPNEECDPKMLPPNWNAPLGQSCNAHCKIIMDLHILQVIPPSCGAIEIEGDILCVDDPSNCHKLDAEFTEYLGNVNVTEVDIVDFNTNYDNYIPEYNRLENYNLLAFGWCDCNGKKDLSSDSALALKDFMNKDGAVIFGHDTFWNEIGDLVCGGTHTNFNSLMNYAGISGIGNWDVVGCIGAPPPGAPSTTYFSSVQANPALPADELLFTVPYLLPNSFNVKKTHVSCQVLDAGTCTDVDGLKKWYFDGIDQTRTWANTCGKVEMIQLGHTTGIPQNDEQKTLINMLYYIATQGFPICGDGTLEGIEECDDGNTSNNDSCLTNCQSADCGDGYIWTGFEVCDDGANGDDTDACYDDCTYTYCGDNIIQNLNGHGDFEECDDGNNINGDGCDENCFLKDCNILNTENFQYSGPPADFDFYYIHPPTICESFPFCECNVVKVCEWKSEGLDPDGHCGGPGAEGTFIMAEGDHCICGDDIICDVCGSASISQYCECDNVPCANFSPILKPECEALHALYTDTKGDSWYNSWTNAWDFYTTSDFSGWYGITTDDDGHVIEISLSDNRLDGSITDSQISNLSYLTNLDISENWGIDDIDALSNLTNLTSLNLYKIPWLDVNPITNLPNLAYLNVGRNRSLSGSNLNIFNTLIGLNELEMRWCDISNLDIDDLNPPNLTYLQVWRNNISDLSFLDIPSLTHLVIAYNNEFYSINNDISHLSNLEYLNLRYNDISDISSLNMLINLKYLDLSRNRITDISVLSSLTSLEYLDLDSNSIDDLDLNSLSNLTNLNHLDLGYNDISDISPLSNLISLEYLDLQTPNLLGTNPLGDIVDISILENLTNLNHLNLRYNDISDISPLSNLTSLEYLDLNSNSIDDLDLNSLSNLTNLEYLNLRYNDISDISSLNMLINLKYLDLDSNSITDISVLSSLTSLEYLDLSKIYNLDNLDISDLEDLNNLKYLNLGFNNISDISALSNLKLRYLFLNDNNFNSLYSIKALIDNGVFPVFYDVRLLFEYNDLDEDDCDDVIYIRDSVDWHNLGHSPQGPRYWPPDPDAFKFNSTTCSGW